MSALPSLSQFGRGRLSLVAISFYALSLLFGPCRLSEFTLAGLHFCTFLYRPCTTTTWKCLTARFMEDVNKRRRISFSLYKLECGPQEINPREIRLHLQFSANWNKRDSVWKTGIHFKSDVFTAVAVVDAKAPWFFCKVTYRWCCSDVALGREMSLKNTKKFELSICRFKFYRCAKKSWF